MTLLSKSSNQCVSQVTQKPFLLTSVEIEKGLRQSTSFRGLTCESSRLSLDPKIWHGSYFYLEILVCKFWQNWKMDHLPMLSGSWLTKKSCTEGDQLRGGLAKYVRVDTRFQFTTWHNNGFCHLLKLLLALSQGGRFLMIVELNRK